MKEATDGKCYYLPTEDWGWGDYASADRPEADSGFEDIDEQIIRPSEGNSELDDFIFGLL